MSSGHHSVIASWSGGKDCCLAVHRAIRGGAEVKALMNMVAAESGRCCFHGLPGKLLALQAECMGFPLFQAAVPGAMDLYEAEFKKAAGGLAQHHDATAMVFGDIYLDEHKDWVERVCRDIGINAVEPLWNESPESLLSEFIDAGFKAAIVTCKADLMGREFIGRILDKAIIPELQARGVCPCGENGEFHTLVVDGPLFGRRIEITKAEPVLRDGFWKHWSWDIQAFESVNKALQGDAQ